jgi:hypothetical protein
MKWWVVLVGIDYCLEDVDCYLGELQSVNRSESEWGFEHRQRPRSAAPPSNAPVSTTLDLHTEEQVDVEQTLFLVSVVCSSTRTVGSSCPLSEDFESALPDVVVMADTVPDAAVS